MTSQIQFAINRVKKVFFVKEGFLKPSFIFLFLIFSNQIFSEKNYNLILISIDTLRYDYISFVNQEKAQTPNIDLFANKSIVFNYAFTTSPLTAPAHGSVFTGLYPASHNIRENLSGKLKDDLETIANTLKKEGYKTYAFVSSATLSKDYGFSKGFDIYDDGFSPCINEKKCFVPTRAGEQTIKIAKQKVDWGKKFFLFLHIFEPHFPYEPIEPYRAKNKDNLYAGEVEYSDFMVGEFLNFIKEKGLFSNTIICIFSDHGEGLKEHQEATHGYLAYNTTLRVPLILYFPNCKAQMINYPVSLIDLYPTFLDILGIKGLKDLPGKNLLKVQDRIIFFEALYPFFYFGTNKLYGLIKSPYKFIYKKNYELYNIYDDPEEKIKIKKRKEIANLKKILEREYINFDKTIRYSENEKQRDLKSLGYLGGADLKRVEGKDPDEIIGILEKLEVARREYLNNNLQQALILYKDLLEEFPKSSVILDEIGLVYYSLKRKEEARDSFEKSIKYYSKNFNALINLANFLSQEGNLKEASLYYEKAMELKPNDPDLLFNYAATCANLGKKERAKILFKKYIELYPTDPEAEKIKKFLKEQ